MSSRRCEVTAHLGQGFGAVYAMRCRIPFPLVFCVLYFMLLCLGMVYAERCRPSFGLVLRLSRWTLLRNGPVLTFVLTHFVTRWTVTSISVCFAPTKLMVEGLSFKSEDALFPGVEEGVAESLCTSSICVG